MQDYRNIKTLDLDELIQRARSGTFPNGCPGGAINELRAQRAYRIDTAQEIFRTAATETRALRADETRELDRLADEARDLTPVIDELAAEMRSKLEGPLHPVGQTILNLGKERIPGS